jgi:hypothetical protein
MDPPGTHGDRRGRADRRGRSDGIAVRAGLELHRTRAVRPVAALGIPDKARCSRDDGYARGLIPLGRIDFGAEALNVSGPLKITIEPVGK